MTLGGDDDACAPIQLFMFREKLRVSKTRAARPRKGPQAIATALLPREAQSGKSAS